MARSGMVTQGKAMAKRCTAMRGVGDAAAVPGVDRQQLPVAGSRFLPVLADGGDRPGAGGSGRHRGLLAAGSAA